MTKHDEVLARIVTPKVTRDDSRTASTGAPESSAGAGWQPIATAPMDEDVLVFVPDENPNMCMAALYSYAYRTGGFWRAEHDYFPRDDFKPTHWMPLPAPPETT